MGFGDVTLMAMIGAYLGWQAAVLTFFIAPFFGLVARPGEVRRLPRQAAGRRKDLERRPRNPVRAVPEHGGAHACCSPGPGSGRRGRNHVRDPHDVILVTLVRNRGRDDSRGSGERQVDRSRGSSDESSPYKRRRPSIVRNFWVYRRLVGLAVVLGLMLWFIWANNAPVTVAFPFGLGTLHEHDRPGDPAERAGRVGGNGLDDDPLPRLAKGAIREAPNGRR